MAVKDPPKPAVRNNFATVQLQIVSQKVTLAHPVYGDILSAGPQTNTNNVIIEIRTTFIFPLLNMFYIFIDKNINLR